MRSLSDLLDPITSDRFFQDHHDRKPLHIPAGSGGDKRALFGWETFNRLLAQTTTWTPDTLKMVHQNRPIPVDQYCTLVHTPKGLAHRPSPAKVQVLLSAGASLIANEVQGLTPELSVLTRDLSQRFAASVGANVYCSFAGVQAFATHFDLHDAWAVHLEGEKTWRLYENRAENPIGFPTDDHAAARRWFEQNRGPLMQEVRMRPGDVLYLPRGWHHDALADGQPGAASLHVTFSVAPFYGRVIFGLLEKLAMSEPAFRAYLAPAERDQGRALDAQLSGLGRRLAEIAASPAFRDEIVRAQARLVPSLADYALPARKPVTLLRVTGAPPPPFAAPVAAAMAWALAQPQFALDDLCARFEDVPSDALRQAVAEAERTGALAR
jgi:ribosomal protein L16 Arg81 hydroxylase